jgi:hypothetical protein
MTTRQRATLLALPALITVIIVLSMGLAWSELPDSMASHWDLGGSPNGHMPPAVLLLVLGGIFVAMWAAVWYSSVRMPFETRSFTAGLMAVGGLLATIQVIAIDVNRGVEDWTAAGEVTAVHIAVSLGVAAVSGVLAWYLAGPSERSGNEQTAAGPMLQLEPGTTPVWSSRGRGPVIVIVGVALLVAAVIVWGPASIVLALVSIPVLIFSEVRATAANKGVIVSLGWLGVPWWTVPLETIAGAEVEEVRPMAYGGWGLRVRPGARAVVVRGGAALRIRRFDRPDLVLTVDDPETGAGLINALVGQRTV